LDEFVADKVESGQYGSSSEVVREAQRLLEERDRARNAELAAFDRELSVRLAALDHGESVESGEVRQRLKQKSREWPG
jgi:antitoxin ParD1/3/4